MIGFVYGGSLKRNHPTIDPSYGRYGLQLNRRTVVRSYGRTVVRSYAGLPRGESALQL
jgi:hypothetical protein